MYIAWERKRVKGRGGSPFLVGDPARGDADYAPPWRGLACEHHGRNRNDYTPFVVRDERADGRLHQQVLFNLPTIRSCCIADPLRRAAWWHDIEWALKLWDELGDPTLTNDFRFFRLIVVFELREHIPKPTAAGIRDFTEFRAARDFEDQQRDETNRSYWSRRIKWEESQRWSARDSGFGSGPGPLPPDCFAILNLSARATREQVKASHRELVMRNHPDRGGDNVAFIRIQAAYEEALAILASRARS